MGKSTFFGFNPPFFTPGRSVMPVQTDERLIKNDLIQLLFTLPGERAFRPTFGTELRRTVFEPSDEVSISILRQTIFDAIIKFEPRLRVSELVVTQSTDEQQLDVVLRAGIVNNPDFELKLELEVPISAPASVPPNQAVI